MDEKILIQSERYNIKKVLVIFIAIGVILSILCVFGFVAANTPDVIGDYWDYLHDTHLAHQSQGYCYQSFPNTICPECSEFKNLPPKLIFLLRESSERSESYSPYLSIIPFVVFSAIGIFIYLCLRSYELTVTDKRIYGVVAWGNRVDLPVDSVSAISTTKVFKGIAVSTSSGKISFLIIKNAYDIYKVLNELLIERQQTKVNASNIVNTQKSDVADELKKFKELLDMGVITQEEFDAKKKQLLGL